VTTGVFAAVGGGGGFVFGADRVCGRAGCGRRGYKAGYGGRAFVRGRED